MTQRGSAIPGARGVLLDARMATSSGIGRYIRGLVRETVRRRPDLELVLLARTQSAVGPWAEGVAGIEPFDAPAYSVREQWRGSAIVRRADRSGRLVHIPHYNAPWALPRRSVVTVHDLIHLDRSPEFPAWRVLAARLVLSRAVSRAGRIIVPSAATGTALAARFPGTAGKIEVVHPGIDEIFRPTRTGPGPDRYCLYVGLDRPHKNLGGLLRVMAAVGRQDPSLGLVVVADRRPAALDEVTGSRFLTGIDDAELARWYSGAVAVLLPSFAEGFGFPAVEALACGAPLIAADIPALREVVGAGGWLLDPHDEPAWVEAVLGVARSVERRSELAARARSRATAFDWATTVDRTIEVYGQATRGAAA